MPFLLFQGTSNLGTSTDYLNIRQIHLHLHPFPLSLGNSALIILLVLSLLISQGHHLLLLYLPLSSLPVQISGLQMLVTAESKYTEQLMKMSSRLVGQVQDERDVEETVVTFSFHLLFYSVFSFKNDYLVPGLGRGRQKQNHLSISLFRLSSLSSLLLPPVINRAPGMRQKDAFQCESFFGFEVLKVKNRCQQVDVHLSKLFVS